MIRRIVDDRLVRRARWSVLSGALACIAFVAACSDQPSTAPAHAGATSRATLSMTLSDSVPTAGTMVSVSLDVQQPDTTPASAIAAFRARVVFDPAQLQYVDETPNDAGVHAVNVVADTAHIAGAAPAVGFTGGRLITLRFQVIDPSGVRSLKVVLDEMRDLTYKDRRADFVGLQSSQVQIRVDAAPLSANHTYGDATGDGAVDAGDVLAILTKDVGLTPPAGFDSVAADVNIDGFVNALDAQIILASLVGRDVSQFRLGDVVGSVPVTVSAVAPDTLRPGITATITGTNFSGIAANDTVMIDTVPAVVTAATATQLTVTVPQTMPCRATHPAVVSVRSSGATGEYRQTLRIASVHTMRVGDTLVFDSDNAFRCNEFPSGEYFAAVYDAAREATDIPDSFQLVSTPVITSNNPSSQNNRIPRRVVQNRAPMPLAWQAFPAGAQIRRRTLAHLKFMQRDMQRAMHAKFGAMRRTSTGVQSSLMRRSLNLAQSVGAYSTFNFIGVTQSGYDSLVTLRARTVYVGTHSIIVEDSASPLAGQMDSYYQQLGPEFDNVMYPILTTNFGNPMAMDANLSNIGKIIMLFTPNVAKYYPGVEAFVTSCDFVSLSDCPASNMTEVFYGDVPTRATTSDGSDPRYDESTPAGWYNEIRGTLVHESKHITSFAEKYARSTQPLFEESWLEEGTAQIASELYARGISGTSWKGGATYAQTLQCEIELCPGYGFTMFDHFAWLYEYEAADNTLSPIDPGDYDGTIYGSAWLLSRWAADVYASTEPSFFKALIQQVTTNGVSNLEARTGQPWTKLLGQWSLALAADHYGLSVPTPGIPSWNTRDVFSGLHSSQQSFLETYPLAMPTYGSAPLSIPGSVATGSAAFFDLVFSQQQSIGIQATATTDLPHTTNLRLAVIRIH